MTTLASTPGTVSISSAEINGKITDLGTGASSATLTFNYGTDSTLTSSTSVSALGPSVTASDLPHSFHYDLVGLTCGTTYYYQASATNDSIVTGTGTILNFTTDPCIGLPAVTTVSVTPSMTSAVLTGNLTDNGGDPSTNVYFEYDTHAAYVSSSTYSYDTTSTPMSTLGTFNATITGLTCGTSYDFRADALNYAGLVFGGDTPFSTSPCIVGSPSVTTNAATAITANTATINGLVTGLGTGAASATAGFTGSVGTVAVSGTITTVPTPFSYNLSGLTCNTSYTFKAGATNDGGIVSYGSTLSFTTSACAPSLPTVATTAAASVLSTTATLNGNLTSTGGTGILNTLSFDYGTSTTYGSTVLSGTRTTTGTFNAPVSGLVCNTTYHFRADATNSSGTANGSDMTFLTSPCIPIVSTTSASAITQTTATLGGNLTSTGGAPSVTVSFDYGTSTSYGSTASAGTMTSAGAITASVTGLVCNTIYHYRAKGVNTAGTATGSDATFTTLPCAPAVTTVSGSVITSTTSQLTGNLTSLGVGASSANVGFYYGPTTAYSLGSVNASTPGPTMTSTGTFSAIVPISGVSCNIPWHLEAWATNAGGTTVTGGDVTFCK